MFTGIVRELGVVRETRRSPAGIELVVACRAGVKEGESVAINGVCLSARPQRGGGGGGGGGLIRFDVVHETLSKTNLGRLREGDRVNVEPSLRYGDSMGGHVVMGHVDGVGTILRKLPANEMTIRATGLVAVRKGSIAVDGVSLTVVDLRGERFRVALIPLTLKKTTLGFKGPGDDVNVEFDRAHPPTHAPSGITRDFLRRAGFISRRWC